MGERFIEVLTVYGAVVALIFLSVQAAKNRPHKWRQETMHSLLIGWTAIVAVAGIAYILAG